MKSCIFFISFSAIYLQIALIRYLSNIYYGALTYFIISIALLGFGASGTFLALLGKRHTKYPGNISVIHFLYLASFILSQFIINKLPLNLLFIFYDPRQIFYLSIFALLLFLPFFFCGLIIGLILIEEKNKELYYGINLMGSGAGGMFALLSLYFLDPFIMPLFIMFPLVISLAIIIIKRRNRIQSILFLLALVAIIVSYPFFSSPFPDQYKDIYQYKLLEKQGDAHQIAETLSPYGKMEAWSSLSGHSTLFAGLHNNLPAPRQITLFNDGDYLGTIFQVSSLENVAILDNTIQSLPYRIIDHGRVLIVGDMGLVNVMLALRFNPQSVTVLLPHESIKKFHEKKLKPWTEWVYKDKRVHVISGDYRSFLLRNKEQYDIIHFANTESLTGSMSGLFSFQEDYNLTVESISAAWNSLSHRGLISLSRGNQVPSKDNLKILLTLYQSAGSLNLDNQEGYLFQLNNYLASINLFSRKAFNRELIENVQIEAEKLNLKMKHNPEESIDYKKLIDDWIYDIRASSDNRPFFNSFFRWKSFGDFYNLYGPYWFRQADLGYLILFITFILVTALAFLFIILPHIFNKVNSRHPMLFYFVLIGFAFMFIEIVLIQKMSLFLGHSSLSVSLILSALLIFSGIGSVTFKRIQHQLQNKLILAISVVSSISLILLVFSRQILYFNSLIMELSILLSWFLMIFLCGITGFFMGWFFSPALTYLEKSHMSSLPLAWAVNGFASVAASPMAVLLSISFGFALPLILSILFYVLAYYIFRHALMR